MVNETVNTESLLQFKGLQALSRTSRANSPAFGSSEALVPATFNRLIECLCRNASKSFSGAFPESLSRDKCKTGLPYFCADPSVSFDPPTKFSEIEKITVPSES